MINDILNKYNIKDYENYGSSIAKIKPISKFNNNAKVILVTATNPTKYGEGKTTTVIGLNDAMNKINQKSIAVLREPSLGPVFGVKGGACGGGKATIIPEDKINLHFTGDMHAITSANNLICAMIDNHIYQGNELKIDKVLIKRCLDMNDRALRNIKLDNRCESFEITAASEIMAVLCLASDYQDLENRINDIVIAYDINNKEIYVKDLDITGSLMSLLSDAFKPNAVKSLEDNLVIVHGGPFANIAHGCSSKISISTASNYAEYVITEAGFGSDMGGYKFTDILSRNYIDKLNAIVIVTTIRSLKYNGDGDLNKGISNLKCHIDNMKLINKNIIVTLNKFDNDTLEDINYVKNFVLNENVLFDINTVYQDGGEGAINLANTITKLDNSNINYLYNLNDSLDTKINKVITNIMHAKNYVCSDDIKEKIKLLDKYKYPICIAKTQYSISDDAKKLGYPKDYEVIIKDIAIKNGAKFIIIYLGNIITMPGLNKHPNALDIKYIDGKIIFPN